MGDAVAPDLLIFDSESVFFVRNPDVIKPRLSFWSGRHISQVNDSLKCAVSCP